MHYEWQLSIKIYCNYSSCIVSHHFISRFADTFDDVISTAVATGACIVSHHFFSKKNPSFPLSSLYLTDGICTSSTTISPALRIAAAVTGSQLGNKSKRFQLGSTLYVRFSHLVFFSLSLSLALSLSLSLSLSHPHPFPPVPLSTSFPPMARASFPT